VKWVWVVSKEELQPVEKVHHQVRGRMEVHQND
jgi:hypothetical protein